MAHVSSAQAIEHLASAKYFGRERKSLLRSDLDCYGLPPIYGAWLVMLDLISDEAFDSEPVYVAVQNFGGFPNYEAPDLYHRIRKSAGFAERVDQFPVDVLSTGDEMYFLSLGLSAIASAWDVLVVNQSETCAVYFSHDEWFCPLACSAELKAALLNVVSSAGGRKLKARERRELSGG